MQTNIHRREFLKASPLASAGAIVGPPIVGANAEPVPGTIREPARDVTVAHECDVAWSAAIARACLRRGRGAAGCEGRADRVERLLRRRGDGRLVNIWHSLKDRTEKRQDSSPA